MSPAAPRPGDGWAVAMAPTGGSLRRLEADAVSARQYPSHVRCGKTGATLSPCQGGPHETLETDPVRGACRPGGPGPLDRTGIRRQAGRRHRQGPPGPGCGTDRPRRAQGLSRHSRRA